MKKLLSLLLVLAMLVLCVACGGNGDESTAGVSGADTASESSDITVSDSASSEAETSPDAIIEASSESESSTAESTEPEESSEVIAGESEPEESSETSVDQPTDPPAFISNYISYGTINTDVRADSDNSVRLTGVDVAPTYGAVVLYTYKTGNVSGLDDFAVARFEYDSNLFGYVKKSVSKVGAASGAKVPGDGFLVVAHKSQEAIIAKLNNIPSDETVFPHGVQPAKNIAYTAKKSNGKISIDGVFNSDEWSSYKIEDVKASNKNWSYAQFEKDNYYSTATYYVAYDNDYIYLCVVVDSPYHYCPITKDNANTMWQYECIQVKVSSQSPTSDYILEHYDHVIDPTASNEGVVRSYGFAVNDAGETCFYENAVTKEFTGLAACSRDDGKQQTVYEVAIPWAEYGITPKKGMKLGFTFSINSTNEEDVSKHVWKNITYRNGGGVIGRNDWSKMPVVTLG